MTPKKYPPAPKTLPDLDRYRVALAAQMWLVSDTEACDLLGIRFGMTSGENEFTRVRAELREELIEWLAKTKEKA